MSTGDPARQQDPYRTPSERTGWYGYIAFAGVMLCVLGIFHAMIGLVAIFQKEYYNVGESGLMVEVSYSGWGVVHLIVGVVVALAGFALTRGSTWARIVAVVVAVLSAIINLAFMSAYPIWSVIMITICFFVIYAVTVHGDPNSLEGY
jgi:hypothetical protein